MSKYPLLTEILHELHLNSYGSGVELPEEEWRWPENSDHLEELAARMSVDERLLIVNGEGFQITELINKYDLQKLEEFIGRVVEGDLTTSFWKLG